MSSQFRVIGIDPGTATLGVAVLVYDLKTQTRRIEKLMTLNGSHQLRHYEQLTDLHGERFARLNALETSLSSVFEHYRPHAIASEGPYMGRFPQAFAALVECLHVVRRAVWVYSHEHPLTVYDPATIKKSVGVSGKSGDKDRMRQAVNTLDWVSDIDQSQIRDADEHAIDALAVANLHLDTLLQSTE